jgi:hypothetical protein
MNRMSMGQEIRTEGPAVARRKIAMAIPNQGLNMDLYPEALLM